MNVYPALAAIFLIMVIVFKIRIRMEKLIPCNVQMVKLSSKVDVLHPVLMDISSSNTRVD